MKKLITLFCASTLAILSAAAQPSSIATVNAPKQDGIATKTDSLWTYGGTAGLTLSQTALKDWAAGGSNALAFNAMFNYAANYKNGKHIWNNRLELAYGMNLMHNKQGGAQKTNDKIYLASMYGYEIGKNWYFSTLLNFQTQFANGWDYKTTPRKTQISQFMAPGYLSVGAGFTWTPKKWFLLTLSPATWRGTFVCDDSLYTSPTGVHLSPFGVPYSQLHKSRMRNEFGADVRAEINYDIMENLNIYTRLELFSNYLEKPQNVDVKWDVILTAKVNKWLSANLTVNMLYDDDIHTLDAKGNDAGPKFQIKEVLGLGLQANF